MNRKVFTGRLLWSLFLNVILVISFFQLTLNTTISDSHWYQITDSDSLHNSGKEKFTNLEDLPKGTYILKLSQNPDFEHGMDGVSFSIHPIIDKTIWFQILAALLIISSSASLFYITRKVFNEEKEADTKNYVPEPTQKAKKEIQLGAIKTILHQHFKDPGLNIYTLTEKLNMNRSALYRKWKEEDTLPIMEYLSALRLEHARELLMDGNYSITDAAIASGFNSQSYFTKVFKKEYGHSPSEYVRSLLDKKIEQ